MVHILCGVVPLCGVWAQVLRFFLVLTVPCRTDLPFAGDADPDWPFQGAASPDPGEITVEAGPQIRDRI